MLNFDVRKKLTFYF